MPRLLQRKHQLYMVHLCSHQSNLQSICKLHRSGRKHLFWLHQWRTVMHTTRASLLDNRLLSRTVFFYFFILFRCLPPGIAHLCQDQQLGLCFATPVRGLELSGIWGLFIQICEIFSQQWNCVFSPLDVAVFLFSRCIFECRALYFTWANFSVSHSKKILILHQE